MATLWNSTYLMLDHALKFEKAFNVLEEEELDYVEYLKKRIIETKEKGHQPLMIGKILECL